MDDWILLAYFWDGRWGTNTRRRVKLHYHPAGVYLVRFQYGTKVTRAYKGPDLRDAYEILYLILSMGDRWRDSKLALDASAAHSRARSAERTGRLTLSIEGTPPPAATDGAAGSPPTAERSPGPPDTDPRSTPPPSTPTPWGSDRR